MNASTTKRDARAYLSRFRPKDEQTREPLHLALVILRSLETLDDSLVDGVGNTLSQLARLGLPSVIVLDGQTGSQDTVKDRHQIVQQCDRLVTALQKGGNSKARILDHALSVSTTALAEQSNVPVSGSVKVQFTKAFTASLRNGTVPIVPPIAYSTEDQRAVTVNADEVLLALARGFLGLTLDSDLDSHPALGPHNDSSSQRSTSVDCVIDRFIVIDPSGGLPSNNRADGAHVFVNLEQEYKDIKVELSTSDKATVEPNPKTTRSCSALHLQNLNSVQKCLSLLPPASSALLATPQETATVTSSTISQSSDLGVATRRPKNPLIFNLLTDKPTISSSLPPARLGAGESSSAVHERSFSPATFFKRGMPVTMIPDPRSQPWRPPSSTQKPMSLDDPRIDFGRLLNLIEDSFNRPLDVEDYVNRIRNKLAGIIVAGEYEGGALLTWELPPGVPDDGSEESCCRMVPYLDKFAVLKRSQGAGGVADIVFSAMVRTCFPDGVCWRSRRENPVNKWYFERSTGSWKLPDSPWSMFWTTPNLLEDQRLFQDYESVCRNVLPSWADKKHIVD